MRLGSRPVVLVTRHAAAALFPTGALIGLALLSAALWLAADKAVADEQPPFASMYADPAPFVTAMAKERRQPSPGLHHVTGISVPHHLLAADLISRGFQAAAGNAYDRVIIVSPDHFSRSRRPMATTRRGIETVFGLEQNDRVASTALLAADDLFDDSELFTNEHGIQALLPIVRHYFPTT
jgi:predicted class III extradiol MEMO1 family dioxygenase